MHELSLVRGIFKTLEEEFQREEMDRLHTVKMKVGQLSNVEPILMQNAFSAVKADQPEYGDVNLEIEVLPIEIYCDKCDKRCQVENYRFVCACGMPTNNVVQGTELLIHQVQFSD